MSSERRTSSSAVEGLSSSTFPRPRCGSRSDQTSRGSPPGKCTSGSSGRGASRHQAIGVRSTSPCGARLFHAHGLPCRSGTGLLREEAPRRPSLPLSRTCLHTPGRSDAQPTISARRDSRSKASWRRGDGADRWTLASRWTAAAKTSIPRILRSCRLRSCPMTGASSRRLTSPISSGSSRSVRTALSRAVLGSDANGPERTPLTLSDESTTWQRRTYQQPVVNTWERRRGGESPRITRPKSWSSMSWITRWLGRCRRNHAGLGSNPPQSPSRGAGAEADPLHQEQGSARPRRRDSRPPRQRRGPSGAWPKREGSSDPCGKPERHRSWPWSKPTRQ